MLTRSLVPFVLFAGISVSASAGIIFQDNFDGEPIGAPSGHLANWIIDGNINVESAGADGHFCSYSTTGNAAGNCVEFGGTSIYAQPGSLTPGLAEITTIQGVNLAAGNYQFSFDYSESQVTDNLLQWHISDAFNNTAASGGVSLHNALLGHYVNSTTIFTLGSDLNSVHIQFAQYDDSGGFGGAVLDNVVLTYLGSSSVPEPNTLLLLGLGLLGLTRQRRAI